MHVTIVPYELHFKRPAGTSRGTLKRRPVWFLVIKQDGKIGIGECAPIAGLSAETPEQALASLQAFAKTPIAFIENDNNCFDNTPSSVRFAIETAIQDWKTGGQQRLFSSDFTQGKTGILMNGLVWLGEYDFMQRQVEEKLAQGCCCIKLKIGSLNFSEELELLSSIRKNYSADKLTLRVDANGAFTADNAQSRLHSLAELDIHSIEQPIRAGQWQEMQQLCQQSIMPIALDEELIGIHSISEKEKLLDTINPQYLILKPSLHGGFSGCEEWIMLAEERGINWWATSYLESNVGLNALAQWVFTKNNPLHQGLGTGQLYTNNIASPLSVRGEQLFYQSDKKLDLSKILASSGESENVS